MAERIWITGGGSGIGRALALAFAARGAEVWISGRRISALEEVVQTAASLTGQVYAEPLDVTDSTACRELWGRLLDQSGGFERIILSAGDHIEMPAASFSQPRLEYLMDVNFYGVTRIIEQALPWLEQQGGQLSVVASLAGYRGLPRAAAYGASKAALINLVESLASELKGSSVDLRLINPGFVKTPLTDRNRFRMPGIIPVEEAAQIIIEGLDKRSFEIRFPSGFARVLSLLSMLPYSVYFALIRKITSQ